MKIEKIVLSDDEMKQAVSAFLKTQGIGVKIQTIEENGYPRKGWKIVPDLEEEVKTKPSIVEQILAPPPADSLEKLDSQLERSIEA